MDNKPGPIYSRPNIRTWLPVLLLVCGCERTVAKNTIELPDILLAFSNGEKFSLNIDSTLHIAFSDNGTGSTDQNLSESTRYEMEVSNAVADGHATVTATLKEMLLTGGGPLSNVESASSNAKLFDNLRDKKFTFQIDTLGKVTGVAGLQDFQNTIQKVFAGDAAMLGELLLESFSDDSIRDEFDSFFGGYSAGPVSTKAPWIENDNESTSQYTLESLTDSEILLGYTRETAQQSNNTSHTIKEAGSIALDRKTGWPSRIESTVTSKSKIPNTDREASVTGKSVNTCKPI